MPGRGASAAGDYSGRRDTDTDAGVEQEDLPSVSFAGGWIDEPGPQARRAMPISRKERRVLTELALGHSTQQIAESLCVSPHTVRTHVKNAMRKLEARTRAHAVAIALTDGTIEI